MPRTGPWDIDMVASPLRLCAVYEFHLSQVPHLRVNVVTPSSDVKTR